MKKIAVLTSGGDSPGMNAAIRAVARAAVFHDIECYGVYRGFQGLIEGDYELLTARSVKNLIQKGGTFLKSMRCEGFRTREGRENAFNQLKKHEIDGLIVIGGDGSFRGASLFGSEFDFPVIGIPSTIDNDVQGTDFSIGFDTALNTVVEAIDKIRDTASSHNRLFLVEVMGRDAGNIALNAGIGAGAGEILIPEQKIDFEELLEALDKHKATGKSSNIVVIAEGDQTGKNISELAGQIQQQRKEYDVRVTVLGHIQRGGSPSCYDRVLASRLGVAAVDALINGETKVMTAVVHGKIITVPFGDKTELHLNKNEELMRVAKIISI